MDEYDYVIIGAGSAGCVIANRLSEDPTVRVFVVDAGASDASAVFRKPGMLALIYQVPKLKEMSDWGYRTTPQKHLGGRQMPWQRSKITGGCSSVNGMLYVRGRYPVGSGDAFLAGLVAGLDRGEYWDASLAIALGAATANAEIPGGGRLDPARAQGLAARADVRMV